MNRTLLTLLCATLLLGGGWSPASEAGSARKSGGSSTGTKPRAATPKFTPEMWAMAKAKYQKDTKHLSSKTAAKPPPTPEFLSSQTGSPSASGSTTIAIPPRVKPSNRSYSMTANRGRRDSTSTTRSVSSSSTASSASGFSSDG